jgi:hypothetical protein
MVGLSRIRIPDYFSKKSLFPSPGGRELKGGGI